MGDTALAVGSSVADVGGSGTELTAKRSVDAKGEGNMRQDGIYQVSMKFDSSSFML